MMYHEWKKILKLGIAIILFLIMLPIKKEVNGQKLTDTNQFGDIQKAKIEKQKILKILKEKKSFVKQPKDKKEKKSSGKSQKKEEETKIVAKDKKDSNLWIQLNAFKKSTILQFILDYQIPIRNPSEFKKKELIEKLIETAKPIIKSLKDTREEREKKKGSKNRSMVKVVSQIEKILSKFDKAFLNFKGESIYLSQEKDKKGYRYIFLFGQVRIELAGNILYGNEIVVKVNDKLEILEVISSGNLLMITNNKSRLIGSKIIVYANQEQGEIFNIKGYQKPFYIKAKQGTQLDRRHYIFHDGSIQMSNLKSPHSYLEFQKAWFYDEEYISAQNITYKIGDIGVAWLPFYYISQNVTLWRSSLGYEKGLGWFTNNSLFYLHDKDLYKTKSKTKKLTSIKGNAEKLALGFFIDYYQRLGFYTGLEVHYRFDKKARNLYIYGGLAYDRAIVPTQNKKILFSNYILGPESKFKEFNNFRWNFISTLDIPIFSNTLFNNMITLKYHNVSDPYFKSQFETSRRLNYDLYDQFGLNDSEISFIGNTKANYNSNAQAMYGIYKQKLWKIYFEINFNLQYDGIKKKTLSYETKDFLLEKHQFNIPNFKLTFNDYVDIIGKAKIKDEDAKKKDSEQISLLSLIEDAKDEEDDDDEKDKEDEKNAKLELKEEKMIFDEIDIDNKVITSYLFKYAILFQFSKIWNYEKDILKEDIEKNNLGLNIDFPFAISYQFLKFSFSKNINFKNLYQRTLLSSENKETTNKLDKNNSYPAWGYKLSSALEFIFFKEYKYLKLHMKQVVNFNHSGLFELPKKNSNGTYSHTQEWNESLTYNSYFEFLKTSISLNSSDQFYIDAQTEDLILEKIKTREEIIKEKRSNLDISLASNIINYIVPSYNISYSRRKEEWLYGTINLKLTTHEPIRYGIFILNELSLNSSLGHYFLDFEKNYLRFSITLDMIFVDIFQITVTSSSSNNKLALYSKDLAEKLGEEPRNFFQDIFDSIDLANPLKRTESPWKLDNISLSIQHDLNDWMFQAQVNLAVKQIKGEYYYFEPTVIINLFLKNLVSIRYPQYKKVWTRQ